MIFLQILILMLFFSCASQDKIEFNPSEPTTKQGCGNAGTYFFDCLKKQSLRWEKIESAQGIFFVESTDRDGDNLIHKGKLCFSEYFCRPYKQTTYSPTIWTDIKRFAPFALLLFFGGAGASSR